MSLRKKSVRLRITSIVVVCVLCLAFVKMSLTRPGLNPAYFANLTDFRRANHAAPAQRHLEQYVADVIRSMKPSEAALTVLPSKDLIHRKTNKAKNSTLIHGSKIAALMSDVLSTKRLVVSRNSTNVNTMFFSSLSMLPLRKHPNQADYINILTKKIVPVDLMKEGPFKFLPDYRNPCWSDARRHSSRDAPIKCLPYFYLVGAPKSGTTDLFSRLVKHPEVSRFVSKEPHWLTRKRYYTRQTSLDFYLRYFSLSAKHIYKETDEKGFHPVIVGDSSASTLWDNLYWSVLPEYRNLTEPPVTNADYIYHLNPKAKIIAILRNPIDRLYSDYLYFNQGLKGPERFHEEATKVVDEMAKCQKKYSLRECVHKPMSAVATHVIRVRIGIYHQHLKEYYRVFPEEQILVIKLEEFTNHTDAYMARIYDFLGVSAISADKLSFIGSTARHANSRRAKDKTIGDMLPKTRRLLQQFYKYHNEELASLLGDQFNFNIDEEIRERK